MLELSDVQINALIAYYIWPFMRISGIFLADPFWSTKSIPRRHKLAFSLVLTVLIAPFIPNIPQVPLVSAEGILILMQQLLIGLMMGFALRITISAVELAGHIMGMQMGLGFAMSFDPQHSAQVPTISRFLTLMVFLIFLSLDGHRMIFASLIDSFTSMPIGQSIPSDRVFELVKWGAQVFAWGLWMSLPIIAALLVTNLAIGVMTRAAPQLNIFTFGFPLTLLVGFMSMYLVIPLSVPLIEELYQQSFTFIHKIIIAKP